MGRKCLQMEYFFLKWFARGRDRTLSVKVPFQGPVFLIYTFLLGVFSSDMACLICLNPSLVPPYRYHLWYWFLYSFQTYTNILKKSIGWDPLQRSSRDPITHISYVYPSLIQTLSFIENITTFYSFRILFVITFSDLYTYTIQ